MPYLSSRSAAKIGVRNTPQMATRPAVSNTSVEGSGTTVSTRSLPEMASVEFHPSIVPVVLVPKLPVIDWASISVYVPGPNQPEKFKSDRS